MIPVTKPFLPPKEEVYKLLNGVWERNWLTNDGPLVREYESKLKKALGLENLFFVSNGTIALQLAIKALGLKGEIITTPFSYVATTSSIVWEGCTPIFVDIDKNTLNIDPSKIESAVTKKTSAILATHCFGNPCDIDAIEIIAKKHNLKVIYDAAHCFGTKYKGKSVLQYGDISTLSLHATKIIHSVEGGAVVTSNPELLSRMGYMRNFGHDGFFKFNGVGINGKNSEFHASMGLCVLNHLDKILNRRAEQSSIYDELLKGLPIQKPQVKPESEINFAYYPILFQTEKAVLMAKKNLENLDIYPRRYFFPSLNNLQYVPKSKSIISNNISCRILCLPIYHELSKKNQRVISNIIIKTLA